MSFDTLRQTLEQAMATGWTTTPVAFENVQFTMPKTAWVMFTIITGQGGFAGIAGTAKSVRDTGLVSCQIFVPENTGTKQSKTIVDSFNALFELKALTGDINTGVATVKSLGSSNGWHQTSVTIPYRRDRNV